MSVDKCEPMFAALLMNIYTLLPSLGTGEGTTCHTVGDKQNTLIFLRFFYAARAF